MSDEPAPDEELPETQIDYQTRGEKRAAETIALSADELAKMREQAAASTGPAPTAQPAAQPVTAPAEGSGLDRNTLIVAAVVIVVILVLIAAVAR